MQIKVEVGLMSGIRGDEKFGLVINSKDYEYGTCDFKNREIIIRLLLR